MAGKSPSVAPADVQAALRQAIILEPSVLTVVVALLAALAAPSAAVQGPAFAKYPALIASVARRAPVQIKSAESRRYRTELRAAGSQPVNFAVHYVLTSIGCGAGCVEVAAIDASTGAVAWLPATVCCWPLAMTEPLKYRRDSRLLIVHGALNKKGSGVHAFVFNGRRFVAQSR